MTVLNAGAQSVLVNYEVNSGLVGAADRPWPRLRDSQ